MAATIELWGHEYTADGYEWTGPAPGVVHLLNGLLDPMGPSGADPNPDYALAQAAAEQFGGRIVRFDDYEYDPNAVY